MILYCFDCGFVSVLPAALADQLRNAHAALSALGVTLEARCPCGLVLHDMEQDIQPLQPVAIAWQDRMLEGVGMGETVKVGHGKAGSNKAAVC